MSQIGQLFTTYKNMKRLQKRKGLIECRYYSVELSRQWNITLWLYYLEPFLCEIKSHFISFGWAKIEQFSLTFFPTQTYQNWSLKSRDTKSDISCLIILRWFICWHFEIDLDTIDFPSSIVFLLFRNPSIKNSLRIPLKRYIDPMCREGVWIIKEVKPFFKSRGSKTY